MRRAYRALYRGQEFVRAIRARGDDVKNFRGRVVLLRAARAEPRGSRRPGGQWICQGRAAAIADGVCGGSAKTDLDLPGRAGWIIPIVIPRSVPSKPRRLSKQRKLTLPTSSSSAP